MPHKLTLLFLAFFLFALSSIAEPFRVGVFGFAPFVVEEEGILRGISVDLWYEATQNLDIQSELRPINDIDEALRALKNNEIDALIGPIPITADRIQNFNFTQPYFRAGLGMVVHEQPVSTWQRIKPLVGKTTAALAIYIVVFLILIGILIWLIERKKNPTHFPMEKRLGIGSGIWFAMVTMTGVGYGDKTPVTTAGRIVSAIWMVTAIIMFSSVTAAITTSFTVSVTPERQPFTLTQLSAKRVAVFSDRVSHLLSSRYEAKPMKLQAIEEAFDLLRNRQVEAIVTDFTELNSFLKNHPDVPALATDTIFNTSHYGFVFNRPTPKHFDEININLVKAMESDQIQDVFVKYTGKRQETY